MADRMVVYNNATKSLLVDRGVEPSRVFVALNSIDQGPVDAARAACIEDSEALRAFRNEHGLDPAKTIVFVSRLSEDNGVDMLIRAAVELRERFATLRVVIVGDGSHRGELESLSESLGLSDVVTFVGAIYGEENLSRWMCSSRVFCYPKNIGLSILHAFGYGLPVVTSDNIAAQNPEIEALDDGVNGLLYRDGDVGALAATLARVLEDDALHASMSKGALETVRGRFSVSNMVDGIEASIRFAKSAADARRK